MNRLSRRDFRLTVGQEPALGPWWPLLLALLLLGYWLFAWALERVDMAPVLSQYWNMAVPLPGFVIFFVEMLHPRVLRHLIPLAAGWWLARAAAIGFVYTLYQMPDRDAARLFLSRLQAGGGGGTVKLADLDLDERRHESVLLRVGGPGRVQVPAEAVAVTELDGRFWRVLKPGKHDLVRFEYVRTLLDLRPQERGEREIQLTTRDGIDVIVDVQVRFRISTGGEPVTPSNPYPYSEAAARAATYARSVGQDNRVATWMTLPSRLARAALRRIIGRYRLDELLQLANAAERPLEAIQHELTRQLRRQLQAQGLELLGEALITRLEFPDAVTSQYVRHWQVYWDARRQISKAEGEAVALEEMEIARAEAEMTMVQAIVDGVQRVRSEGHAVNMSEIVALRLLDALEQTARQSQQLHPLPANLLPQLQQLRQLLPARGQQLALEPEHD